MHLSRRFQCTIITHGPSSVCLSLTFDISFSHQKTSNRSYECWQVAVRWPLIGWDIFEFSYAVAERNLMNLCRMQILNFLCQVCVYRASPSTKMVVLASDCLRHFFNSPLQWFNRVWRNLFRKQVLNFSYLACVSHIDPSTKMTAMTSGWPRHLYLLFNKRREFD